MPVDTRTLRPATETSGSRDCGAPYDMARLLVACPDRPGIVAAVAGVLGDHGANICESQQHSIDPLGGRFFLRMSFGVADLDHRIDDLATAFAEVAPAFDMRWRLTKAAELKRVAIFVSTAGHALQELLWRREAGDLHADIRMVVSNHEKLADMAAARGVPFHHIPITTSTRPSAEQRHLELLERERIDLVVLARYMRILSGDFLARVGCSVINIHHSFLPAFVGANPYQAAHDRGVKLIGATAHYVTEELDAGPIIEQEVHRVDHRCTVEDLRRIGRDVERTALARAVTWHLEDRVLVDGNRTVVFA